MSLAAVSHNANAQSSAGNSPTIPAPPADVALPDVEPVFTDDEFAELVPDFEESSEPELDLPLESIAEFERRLGQSDPDAGNAEAPLGDPELLAPVPPLEEFELTEVEFAPPAPDEGQARLRYRTQVAGLELADDQTSANLRDQFDDLSTLRDGDGEASNIAQVRARLTEDAALLQTVLASEGWYDSRVTTYIATAAETGEDELTAVIDVDPGMRFSFATITIDADETIPPDLIEGNLPIEVGDPIIATQVLAAEAQVALVFPENGYPFAEIGQRDILLDRETGEGDYTLPVHVGPRSRFGDIVTTGDLAFDVEHVELLARFERGDLFDVRQLDDLRQALIATGLFSSVNAEPEATGESAGDDTEYVTIKVEQQAGPPRTIAAQAGYATGEGFRVEGSWTHRNLFPPEGALIVSGVAGTQEQGVGVTFRRSNAGKRDRSFQVSAELVRSDYAAIDGYTARLATQISYDSTPLWQKPITYAFGGLLEVTAENDYDFSLGRRDRRTFYIAGLSAQVEWDRTNDLLDPSEGFRVSALVEPEGVLEEGFHPYVRVQLDTSGYYEVMDSLVVAGRLRLGSIQGIDRFDLAPSRRFYAGGGGSVRGFGYQELGPLAPDGRPIGGRSLNEAAFEVRKRFGDYGAVAFVDIGQSYEETMPQFDDLRTGVGIGARYYTNFGPMRIDVATPLDRREGEGWISVYVSIGQAF